MIAYKIWYDEKHYVQKDTTNELDIRWTTNVEEAKIILPDYKGWEFFFDTLGFHINESLPDSLKILKHESGKV